VSGENTNPIASLPADLFAELERGVTVITPNERAARRVRRLYDLHNQQSGETVWCTANALSLTAWLKRKWVDAVTEGHIIAPILISQEHSFALWERIIHSSPAAKEILNVSGAAEMAQRAYELMCLYQVSGKELMPLDTSETRGFHQWGTQYRKRLTEEQWVDVPGIYSETIRVIKNKSLSVPMDLCLFAMDDLRPAEQSLFSTLRASGCSIKEFSSTIMPARTHKLSCEDVEQEIEYAAQWARKRIIEDPCARIGVIVPALSALRPKIERTFLYELQHSTFLNPDAAEQRRAFEISLGTPLSAQPLVATALLVLRLACGKISLADLCTLLRSPFLGGAMDEVNQRNLLEAELRERNMLSIGIEELLSVASITKDGVPRPYACPVLCEKLAKFNAAFLKDTQKNKPSGWNKTFLDLLKDTGWPGDRVLNSSEYQAQQKFKELLADFATLDSVLPEMKLSDSVQKLQRMASRQTFQTENLDAPVQILGPLEAASSNFDHLWVLGLNEDAWPATAAPNPFLPLMLQRKHGMPHSSTEADLEFTQKITTRLFGCAMEVMVSCSRTEAGSELRESPLIGQITPTNKMELGFGGKDIHATAAPSLVEWVDTPLPHPQPASGSTHHGGTRIFELQSACAFRAFAEIRLGAKPLDEPGLGLDARKRGSLAHAVMFAIWNEIKDSARLHELAHDSDKFNACIRTNVQSVLQHERSLRGDEWHRQYAELETERIAQTVKTMLDLDLDRALAFTVEHKEEKEQIELGGVRMSLRKDRVDRLEDGRIVIIDYKSGAKSPSSWKSERPEEPQLPVYAVTSREPLAAIAFANLKSGKEGYTGIAVAEGILPKVKACEKSVFKTSIAEQVIAWRAPLEKLAADYIAGGAVVAPKHRVNTCKHCRLQTLCRVAEIDPLETGADETESGDDDV